MVRIEMMRIIFHMHLFLLRNILVRFYGEVFMLLSKNHSEVVSRRCSEEKVLLEISQSLQGNTFVRVSFLIKFKIIKL